MYSETGGAVTEGSRVATEAERQSYPSNGYEEYEFIAEPKACDICKPLDGKIFKVLDMVPGLNASPMHPNCRCATAAHYSDDGEYERVVGESEKMAKETTNTDVELNISTDNAIIKAEAYLQHQFSYYDQGVPRFIPKNTLFEATKTIAGFGTDKELRIAEKLAQIYGGEPKEWAKKVGKIESNCYIFDLHWYEHKTDAIQRDMKLKFRKEK